mgnify:FL=1
MNAKEALRHILTSKMPQRSGPNSDLLTQHEMELHQFIREIANVAKEALEYQYRPWAGGSGHQQPESSAEFRRDPEDAAPGKVWRCPISYVHCPINREQAAADYSLPHTSFEGNLLIDLAEEEDFEL